MYRLSAGTKIIGCCTEMAISGGLTVFCTFNNKTLYEIDSAHSLLNHTFPSFHLLQFAYTVLYSTMAYYVLIVYTETTTFQAFFVIALCLGIQLLSHLIFEGGIPQRLPRKEDSVLFQVLDLANEFFLAQFHFMLTLMVRCDLLPILRWRSDASLHKLITTTQELKYGKKAP